MIPHHVRAVDMCDEAGLGDSASREFCDRTISQRQEIVEMERIIGRPR